MSNLPSSGIIANEGTRHFTQDGPGKGLEPKEVQGGRAVTALLAAFADGSTDVLFSDSYIGEWPKTKGDGSVTRHPGGPRTTELNASSLVRAVRVGFPRRNSIVVLNKDRTIMKTGWREG